MVYFVGALSVIFYNAENIIPSINAIASGIFTGSSATGGFVPSIDTREIETQVLVRDGQTVVLGGIYETERRETINKVPVLDDIPGVGTLFRSTTNVSNKAELYVLTCRPAEIRKRVLLDVRIEIRVCRLVHEENRLA